MKLDLKDNIPCLPEFMPPWLGYKGGAKIQGISSQGAYLGYEKIIKVIILDF